MTRRLIKIPPDYRKEYQSCWKDGCFIEDGKLYWEIQTRVDDSDIKELKPPYQPGDVLYVRETWRINPLRKGLKEDDMDSLFEEITGEKRWKDDEKFIYRADFQGNMLIEESLSGTWRPSIHMPKEAARIFLKVTAVRVDRLQDITNAEARKEGAETDEYLEMQEEASICGLSCQSLRDYFGTVIWDSTIKRKDLPSYGWEANPFVWVIEFEVCKKIKERR